MDDIMPSACGECLGRREFLARSALFAAAAAALAACGAVDSMSPTGLGSTVTLKVTDYPALANVGGIALVTTGGERLAIVRTGASTYVALSRVCPHQGGIVNISGGGFQCPQHGAMFSATGQWMGGQPTTNMHAYATSFDANTQVLTVSP